MTDWLAPPILAAALTLAGAVLLYLLGRFRETKLRFIADKRAAYTEYVSAVQALDVFARDFGEFEKLMEEEQSDERSAKMTIWLLQRGVTEADLALQVAQADRAVKVPEITETAPATRGQNTIDLALMRATAQLMFDRTKASHDRASTAAAVISLVAPETVVTRIEQLEKLVSTDPTYARAGREVVAAMRRDLGVGSWRRVEWWRSPDRWWRPATVRAT